MAKVISRTPEDWDKVNPDTRFGIYVVQSEKDKGLYRVGSVGIRSEKTRFLTRIKLHGSKAREGNWTVENRPWKLIWAAEIQSSSDVRYGVLALEYALFAEFAKHFRAINTSGFHAVDRESEIMRVIEQFQPTMELIAKAQL